MATVRTPRIQFGFWDLDQRLNPDLRKSLEVFYYRIPTVSDASYPMLWDADVDRLMKNSSEIESIEWLCVVAVGTLFAGQDKIAQAVEAETRRFTSPILVAGQPVEKAGKYPGLSEQMFLVHMPTYRRLGRPVFGGFETGGKILNNYVSESSLKPTVGLGRHKVWSCGWSFIDASLKAGLEVPDLSLELRRQKAYTYPDDQIEKLNRNLELFYQMEDLDNPAQRKVLGYLFNKRFGLNPKWKGSGVNLVPREPTVFMFNTEDMLPGAEWIAKNRKPLDFYFGPCAGFLDLAALNAHGFKAETKLVYYDYNAASLDSKRRLLEDWDGDAGTLQGVVEKIRAADPLRSYYTGVYDLEIGKLLNVLGGPQALQETWTRVRALPKEFLELNLLKDHHRLFEKIEAGQTGVLAISDIFTGQNELLYGYSGIQKRYREFLANARHYPGLILSGKDTRGMPFTAPAIDHSTNSERDSL